MIYLVNLFIIPIYALLIKCIDAGVIWRRTTFCIIAFLHLALFHALRDPYVYPDNVLYSEAFTKIGIMSLSDALFTIHRYTEWGLGYVFLNNVLFDISESSMILFVVTSFLIVGGVMWIVYKFSYIPLLSVCVYFIYPTIYYQSLYVLRQHLAIMCVLIMVCYIKKYRISIPFFLLSFLFHASSIAILPFFFFRFLDFKKLNLRFLVIVLILFVVFRMGLSFFMSYFERFDHYMDNESTNNIVPVIMLGLLLIMHAINKSFLKISTESDKNILYYLTFSVIMCIFLIGLPGGGRLAGFYIYIIPLALPLLFKYNDKTSLLKRIFTISYCCLILFLWYLNINNSLYHEYRFFQGYI